MEWSFVDGQTDETVAQTDTTETEPSMHAFYLTVKTADGNYVERFTEVDQLFLAVDTYADLYDYKVTTSYLHALTA